MFCSRPSSTLYRTILTTNKLLHVSYIWRMCGQARRSREHEYREYSHSHFYWSSSQTDPVSLYAEFMLTPMGSSLLVSAHAQPGHLSHHWQKGWHTFLQQHHHFVPLILATIFYLQRPRAVHTFRSDQLDFLAGWLFSRQFEKWSLINAVNKS